MQQPTSLMGTSTITAGRWGHCAASMQRIEERLRLHQILQYVVIEVREQSPVDVAGFECRSVVTELQGLEPLSDTAHGPILLPPIYADESILNRWRTDGGYHAHHFHLKQMAWAKQRSFPSSNARRRDPDPCW